MTTGPTAASGVFGLGRMFQGGATFDPITLWPSQMQHVATFAKALPAGRVQAQAQVVGLFP